jgi:non-ribosomal peptide synthetase component F
MFMALLAAYVSLLHCFSGQSDIIVGSPISQRKRARFEDLIGCFIDTLVLRTNLEGDPGFLALLARVKETALNAYNHSDVPFDKIVEEVQPRGSRGQTPIFQVWMNLEKSSAVELQLPELTLTTFPLEKQWSKFDLALLIQDRSQIIDCVFEYDTDLFDTKTISRYASAFETILSMVVAEPETKLSSLNEMLAEQDRQARLIEEREYQDSIKRKLSGVRRRAV